MTINQRVTIKGGYRYIDGLTGRVRHLGNGLTGARVTVCLDEPLRWFGDEPVSCVVVGQSEVEPTE